MARYDGHFYRFGNKVNARNLQLDPNFLLTGILSVKMVGLFVTALVGLYTIEDLWEKFGDLRMPVASFFFVQTTLHYLIKSP
jgi:dolichyl-phosphate-mannose--protein O-mannosyl transferase